jgi:predicted nucleic acid-binding protein
MAYKLFIDTNVYLDFLLQRGGEWDDAAAIFKLAEQGEVAIYTSSSSAINLMYVMDTYKLTRRKIIEHTLAILSYTKLVNPDNITFEIALSSSFRDLEDSVQYHTGLEVKGISYFITSNIKDYKNATTMLPVMTPGGFMEKYKKTTGPGS